MPSRRDNFDSKSVKDLMPRNEFREHGEDIRHEESWQTREGKSGMT
jgi:hypothetical protein